MAASAGIRRPRTPWHGSLSARAGQQDAEVSHTTSELPSPTPEPRWRTLIGFHQDARAVDRHRLRKQALDAQRALQDHLSMQVSLKKQEKEGGKVEDEEVRRFQHQDMLRARAEEAATKEERKQAILELQQEHNEILQARAAQKRATKEREREEIKLLEAMEVAAAQEIKQKELARSSQLHSQLAKARDESTALALKRKEADREKERHALEARLVQDAATAEAVAKCEAAKRIVNERQQANYMEAAASQKAKRQEEIEAGAKFLKELAKREDAQLAREKAKEQEMARLHSEAQAILREQIRQKQAAQRMALLRGQEDVKQFEADLRDFKAAEQRKRQVERQRLRDYQQELAKQLETQAARKQDEDLMSHVEAQMNKRQLQAVHSRKPLSAR
mmetsp:Transcript_35874/g.82349  ORF Transcript_35874/g.82349 Transcript_35874/m.82349 type:complete len:391 (+) Transcript_35874:128-1300(+)